MLAASKEKIIISLYMDYGLYGPVAKEVGCSSQTVKRVITKAGLPQSTRKDWEARTTKMKEVFWYDDKSLGYLCGLIATDAWLSPTHKRIFLALSSKDLETINSVKQLTCLNAEDVPVTTYLKNYNNIYSGKSISTVSKIALTLPRLYDFCISIGITPAKTLTLDVNLEGQTDEFKWYFLRGFIDGDGCVPLGKSGKLSTSRIQVASVSYPMVKTLRELVGGTLQVSKLKTNRNLYYLTFTASAARKLAMFLPTDKFCMTRKTEAIEKIRLMTLDGTQRECTNLKGSLWDSIDYDGPSPSKKSVWDTSNKAVTYWTFRYRSQQGWDLLEAANTPPVRKRKLK